jgi:LPXTG-site transpeptidase (sortase) family protein
VGVTKNNVLDTPKNIHDAAWYSKSATPGSGYGAVLIDAHNGGYTKDGIFAKLSKLAKGDEISVERGDGKVFTYIVTSNVTMGLDEVNERGMKEMMVSSDSSKEGLSLITCAGNYVPRLGQFDKRVMVRAVVK